MLSDEQWATLSARAQSIDMLARAFEVGNLAAIQDIDWGDSSQYLLSELANALLALKEARGILRSHQWVERDSGYFNLDMTVCLECGNLRSVGCSNDCKLAKVLGEGE